MHNKKAHGLISHIHILDLTDKTGGFCSKLLADMGARVIKVEKPGGASLRRIGPFFQDTPGLENSLSFWYHNTNKLGITLDPECHEGREIFFRLLKKYDIVIESFPPEYLKNIGLDYKMLETLFPKLILASITDFGQDGPRSHYKSCDIVTSAFSGQMYVSGDPSTPPLKMFGKQSSYVASLYAAVGIMLAIQKRNQSNVGEHLDVSIQDSMTSMLEHVMIRYFQDHTIVERQGNLHWSHEFRIFQCKDGFIHFSLFQQWETLVEWMDQEGMAEDLGDEVWRDDQYRRENDLHIIEVLERWIKTHTVQELFELGQLRCFPWAPVRAPKDVIQCPHLKERGFFVPIEHKEMGAAVPYPGVPYKWTKGGVGPRKRAPTIGEDNERIYCGELGMSREELKDLSAKKVI